MSLTKKDRKIHADRGKSFPAPIGRIGASGFAAAIAQALRRDFGEAHGAVKRIVALTTANERAVKNWYEGRNGPSGEFLIALCRHSDEVLECVLTLAGRAELVTAKKLVDARSKLVEILTLIDQLQTLA